VRLAFGSDVGYSLPTAWTKAGPRLLHSELISRQGDANVERH